MILASKYTFLIAKMLGEKKQTDANEIFSTLVLSSVFIGALLATIGQVFLKPVAMPQGARGMLLENSLLYGRIYLLGTPACLIQFEFQALYQTSGKGRLFPIIFYSRINDSQLRLVRGPFHGRELLKICANGSSEMVNNISISIVSLFYNIQLITYGGADGIAPIISFHYGARNHEELHSLLKKSILLIAGCLLLLSYLQDCLFFSHLFYRIK